jgi:hypothetical protein
MSYDGSGKVNPSSYPSTPNVRLPKEPVNYDLEPTWYLKQFLDTVAELHERTHQETMSLQDQIDSLSARRDHYQDFNLQCKAIIQAGRTVLGELSEKKSSLPEPQIRLDQVKAELDEQMRQARQRERTGYDRT